MKKIKSVYKRCSFMLLFLMASVGMSYALINNPVKTNPASWGETYLTGTTFSIANDNSESEKTSFQLSEIIFGRPIANLTMGSSFIEKEVSSWADGGSNNAPSYIVTSNPAVLNSSYRESTDDVNRLIFKAPKEGDIILNLKVSSYKSGTDFAFSLDVEELSGLSSASLLMTVNGEFVIQNNLTISAGGLARWQPYQYALGTEELNIQIKLESGSGAVLAFSNMYVYGGLDVFSISASETSVGLGTPITLTAFSATEMDLGAVKWHKNFNGAGFVALTDENGRQIIGESITDTPEAGETCYKAIMLDADGVEVESNIVCVTAEYKCTTNAAYAIFTDDFGKLDSEKARNSNQYVGNNYTYVGDCGMLQTEGTYAVMANARYGGCNKDKVQDGCGCTNASEEEMWFRDIYDHTQNGVDFEGKYGGMLLVNANAQLVYSRQVNIPCANTNLIFSAWFATASNKATASVRFFVKDSNGNEIKEATLVLEGDDIAFSKGWVKGETSFYTGEETNFTVEIHSYNEGGQGNDFLIDDISFSICVPEISLSVSSSVPEVEVENDKVSGSCGSALNLDLEEGMAEVVFIDPYYLWYVKEQGSNEFVYKPEFDNKISIETQITPYTQYYVVATANESDAQEYIAGRLPKCTPVAMSNIITVLCSPNLEVSLVERTCNSIKLEAKKYDDPSNLVKFWWQISKDGRTWSNINVPNNTDEINYDITSDSYFRINSDLVASSAVKVSLRSITLTSMPTKAYIGGNVKLTASTIKYELGDDDKYQWFDKNLTSGTYTLLNETSNSFIYYTLQSEKASVKVVAEGCEAEVAIEKLEPLEIKEKSRDCNEITIEGITDIEPNNIKWYYSVDGNEYTEHSQTGTPITFDVSEENVGGVYIKGKTTDGKESEPIVVYPIVMKNTIFNSSAVLLNPENGLMVNNNENVVIKTEISGIELKAEDKINYKSCAGNILQSSTSNEFTTSLTEENKCFITEFKGCISDNIEFKIRPKEIIWPTAFNPLNQDGINDTFVTGYGIKVMIMDRYGNVVAESEDGWDGTIRGGNAMPGVYFYVATLPDGTIKKGTIELVHYVK